MKIPTDKHMKHAKQVLVYLIQQELEHYNHEFDVSYIESNKRIKHLRKVLTAHFIDLDALLDVIGNEFSK